MSGELSRLKGPDGANRPKMVKGRGHNGGKGKTAGRGSKGQKARKSGPVRPGFEGGQMPIQRRMPKRGFVSMNRKQWTEIGLSELNRFDDGAVLDFSAFRSSGLAKGDTDGIKILGNGDVEKKLTVRVNRITTRAKERIEAKGGTVELVPEPKTWVRSNSREARRAQKRAPAV
jgi:large subunit ribosomal protein L15